MPQLSTATDGCCARLRRSASICAMPADCKIPCRNPSPCQMSARGPRQAAPRPRCLNRRPVFSKVLSDSSLTAACRNLPQAKRPLFEGRTDRTLSLRYALLPWYRAKPLSSIVQVFAGRNRCILRRGGLCCFSDPLSSFLCFLVSKNAGFCVPGWGIITPRARSTATASFGSSGHPFQFFEEFES